MIADVDPVVLCRDCGATLTPGTTRCWLCGTEVSAAQTARDDGGFIEAELVPERQGGSHFSFTLTAILATMTIFAVAAGLFNDAPGLSFLVLLVGLPALSITVVRMGRRRRRGEEVTWSDRILTFVVSSIAVLGIILMVTVASVVALFIYCWIVCTASGGKFF
jgi:hypothetical protein